jgi:mediator of RNA polymerase II transcription subunit 21
LFLLQFDVLVASLPISETGEEAQLKRIAELQVCNSQLSNRSLLIED